jgi:serine/threonine protein phosphatase 1
MQSYDRNSPFPSAHFMFYLNLELYYETNDFIFIHAGLKPGVPLELQTEEDLLWIRHEFLASNYDFGKTIVFGHTPFEEPYITPGRIGLDTGAVYGGPLTCMELTSRRLISVP